MFCILAGLQIDETEPCRTGLRILRDVGISKVVIGEEPLKICDVGCMREISDVDTMAFGTLFRRQGFALGLGRIAVDLGNLCLQTVDPLLTFFFGCK